MQPLLEGRVESDESIALRRKCERLERDLEDAREEIQDARKESAKAIRALTAVRRQLEPWHEALSALFGELDFISSGEGGKPASHANPVWDTWMRKLPGKQAEVIQALVEHGEMNVQQLRVATHSATQTIYETTSKLYKLGLLNKNGGRYSLKEMP